MPKWVTFGVYKQIYTPGNWHPNPKIFVLVLKLSRPVLLINIVYFFFFTVKYIPGNSIRSKGLADYSNSVFDWVELFFMTIDTAEKKIKNLNFTSFNNLFQTHYTPRASNQNNAEITAEKEANAGEKSKLKGQLT